MKPNKPVNCSLTTEFLLVQENILILNERITQLYVIQSEENPYVWFGLLFVDRGIYMGTIVKFTMVIRETYPKCPCPEIIFHPIPYHPLVDPETGQLDTKFVFSDWTGETHKLHQLLLFVKRVFYQAETYAERITQLVSLYEHDNGSSQKVTSDDTVSEITDAAQAGGQTSESDRRPPLQANEELVDKFQNLPATLEWLDKYRNDADGFRQRIDSFKQGCHQHLYDTPTHWAGDNNALRMTEWDAKLHEPIRNLVLAGRYAPTNLFASYHKETDSVSFIPGSETD